jgi:WD40 repeat protein
MAIVFTCGCGKVLRTSDEHAGQKGKCPHCGRVVVTPSPAAPPIAVPAPPPVPEPAPPAAPEPPAQAAAPPEPAPPPEEAPATPAAGAAPEPAADEPQEDLEAWHTVRTLHGHHGPIRCLSFSPDGTLLATGGDDHTVQLWDLRTGRATSVIQGFKKPVLAVAIHPKGDRVAAASGGPGPEEETCVRIWELVKPDKPVVEWKAHHRTINALCYSRDGHTLVTGGDAGPDHGTFVLWDPQWHQVRESGRVADDSPVRALTLYPDGERFAAAAWQTITLWHIEQGILTYTINSGSWDQFHCVSISPDGRVVAGGCFEYVRLWDMTTDHTLHHLTGYNGDVRSVTFSPDGTRLVGISLPEAEYEASLVKVWDTTTWEQLASFEPPHGGRITCAAFAPRGKLLATAGEDGAVNLWVPLPSAVAA